MGVDHVNSTHAVACDSGVYFLCIRLPRATRLVLRQKTYVCPRGWYVYTGSAQRHLSRRIARHARSEKKMHWHIDYLLAVGELRDVRVIYGAPRADETAYAQKWLTAADGVPIPGFGASDSSAYTHCVWFSTRARLCAVDVWREAERLRGSVVSSRGDMHVART